MYQRCNVESSPYIWKLTPTVRIVESGLNPREFFSSVLHDNAVPSVSRLLNYPGFGRLFKSREVKARDEERMRRTGGTPQ